MDKNIGVILDGRYELKKRIGVGGMADVYRAYDRTEGRDVAVKILKNEYTRNDEFLQRFKNESKAVSMLSHPNIVKVLDVGFNDDIRFIVMEYIDGVTLKDYMELQKKLDWKEASHFIIQILRALGHAHDRGIIHRDIKPQNIMMFEDGTIKVMDFGIARFTYELGITATAQTIGSVHYISPEQACGKMTDGASDIYSVGILLYEMLTGTKPFDEENPLTVALMQMNDLPQMPRSINPDISEGMQEIILRAIEKDPADRYRSAREMIRDIEQLKSDPSATFGYRFTGTTVSVDDIQNMPDIVPAAEPVPQEEPAEEEPYNPLDYDPDESTPNYFIGTGRKNQAAHDRKNDIGDIEYETPGSGAGIKLATVGTVVVMVVVVAVIAGFVFRLINGGGAKEETAFAMPSLVQYNYEEMVNRYAGKLTITVQGEPVYSEYEANTIVEQSVEPGTSVEKGTEVFVTISNGKNVTFVPDVSGKTANEAIDMINEAGLEVMLKPIFNDKVPYDMVIRVSPAPGTEMAVKQKVTLYVSKGAQSDSKIIPNVVGKQEEEAVKLLEDEGFTVETERKDDKAPEGEVFMQNFPGDTLVNPNEKIILYISTGRAPEEDVTYTVKFPEGVTGVATFRVYADGDNIITINDINIDGYEDFSFDITGSGKQKIIVEITNIHNGESADLGVYNFDFTEKKYEAAEENVKDALIKTGLFENPVTTAVTTAHTAAAVTTHAAGTLPEVTHTPQGTEPPESTEPAETEAPVQESSSPENPAETADDSE